jgi:hypothetical protein
MHINIWLIGNPALNLQACIRTAEDDCWHAVKSQVAARPHLNCAARDPRRYFPRSPQKSKPRTYTRGFRRFPPLGAGEPDGVVQAANAPKWFFVPALIESIALAPTARLANRNVLWQEQ